MKEGDAVDVKVLSVDRDGKIRLSRRELLPLPEGEEGERAQSAWPQAREGGPPPVATAPAATAPAAVAPAVAARRASAATGVEMGGPQRSPQTPPGHAGGLLLAGSPQPPESWA